MKTANIFFCFALLIAIYFVGCSQRRHLSQQIQGDERDKVVSFLCNNADSISVYTLKSGQCGDSIYLNYFDSLTDDQLRPKIVNNYIKSSFYKKMFRDSLTCDGKGLRHEYLVDKENIYRHKLTMITDYQTFKRIAKPKDVYFVICRPLTLDNARYYLVSIEQKGSLYLERLWIKVEANGCIKEIGNEVSIQ